MEGHIARMGEMKNTYGILVRKSEGNTPLGRPRHGWKVNMRMDPREIGWEFGGCLYLTQNRVH
jgi:hypothetical protein